MRSRGRPKVGAMWKVWDMYYKPDNLFKTNMKLSTYAKCHPGKGDDVFAKVMLDNAEAVFRLIPQKPSVKTCGSRTIYVCYQCGELLIGKDRGFCYKCGQAWERKE